MRRRPSIPTVAVFSFLVLACPILAGELALEVWDGEKHAAVRSYLGEQGIRLEPIKAEALGLPAGPALRARLAVGRSPSQSVTLIFTASQANTSQTPDELRVAVGPNPDFGKAQVFTAESAPKTRRPPRTPQFKDVQFSFSHQGRQHPLTIDITLRQARLSSRGYGSYKIKTFRAGLVSLDGQEVKVLLIDRTGNGLFDDRFSADHPNGDLLLIDVNGNKKLDRPPGQRHMSYWDFGGEIFPLTEMLQINSGYYKYELGPNGSSLTLQRIEPQLGTVVTGGENVRAQLLGPVFISLGDKTAEPLTVPSGNYTSLQSTHIRKDESGRKWSLTAVSGGGEKATLEVKPGQTTTIELVELVKLGATISSSGQRGQYISADFKTDLGLRITNIEVNNKRPDVPKYEIHDSNGKLVASGKLEYG